MSILHIHIMALHNQHNHYLVASLCSHVINYHMQTSGATQLKLNYLYGKKIIQEKI
jgi:hypothetical protein